MIELGATLNSRKSFITEEEKKEYIKNFSKERYQNNKEEIKKYSKEYYQNNKTEIDKKWKKYYNDKKTQINERRTIKVKCEFCNCELQKNSLREHQKSQKCMKFQEFVDVE